jgi:O-antigen/teichoic acid export membrane protein/glycosyltransferase involved in cell wall biosynthesis
MRTEHIIFRNMVAQVARLGAQGVAHLLVGIFIARWLGFGALGIYAFISAVVAAAAIFSDAGITTFLSAEAARDRQRVSEYVNHLLLPAAVLGTLLGGLSFAILRLAMTKAQLGIAGSLCATVVIAAGIGSVLRGAMYAFERLELEFYSIVVQEGLFLLGVVGLLISRASLPAVFAAFIVTRWVGLVVLLYLYHRRIARLEWRPDWRATFDILRRTLPYGSHALSSVISLRADTAAAYVFVGPPATGLYEAAANISFRLAILLPRIFTTALLPSLARQFAEKGARSASRATLKKLVLASTGLGLTVCAFFIIFARLIFRLAYGDSASGATLVRVLAGAIAFHYLSALLGTLLTAQGLQKLRTRSVGIAATAAVLLNVALVPLWGARGAGLAILLSQFLMCALLTRDSFRVFAAAANEENAARLAPLESLHQSADAAEGKIGIVVRAFGPPWNEGVRNLAHELARFLIARRRDVTVVATRVRNSDESAAPPVAQARAHGFFSWPLVAGWKARKLGLSSLLFFSDYSVGVGLKALLLRWTSGARVVVYVPGLSRFHRLNLRGTLPANGARYAVGSKFLQNYLPGADLVPPWVSLDRAVRNGQCATRRNRILYLGSFNRGRGVPELLLAHALVRTHRPAAHLYIAWNGSGELRSAEIRRLIYQLRLPGSVTFLDVNERAEAYEKADVVVIPRVVRHYMAFPIRLLEAAQAGKPVVVTTACEMDKLVDGCGLSAQAGDPGALARAIEALLGDDELYSRCQQGCARFFERYHPQKSLNALCQML